MMIINLGCGSSPLEGAVNVDRANIPGVDVVYDLDSGPWPFPDSSADRIEAIDVFEHVREPLLFMAECWRILKVGGVLYMQAPHYLSKNAFTDPTHLRFCTNETWDYWVVGKPLYESFGAAYGGHTHPFEMLSLEEVLSVNQDGWHIKVSLSKVECIEDSKNLPVNWRLS
jgi:SAM-dependent methyltransferase